MKATITYTVNCSHKSFETALARHLPNIKFHEVAWRDTENYGDDIYPDFYSTFVWPNKRCPELTKALFFKMAFSALACGDRQAATSFCIDIFVKDDDGKQIAVTIADGVNTANEKEYPPSLYVENYMFSEEMSKRLQQIAALATKGAE